jgi:hypothetical protein
VIRRSIAVLAILSALGVVSACGGTSTTTNAGSGTTPSAAASPSPSAAGKGNTQEVCDAASKVITEESGKALGMQIGLKIKADVDVWVAGLRKLAPTATDPELKTALTKAADSISVLGTDAYLAKIKTTADVSKIETDLTSAGSGLDKLCV